jgi:DNA-binding winged helix-turn-helix (wHTH) protein
MADELVARSEQLSASRGYRGLLAKCALIRAALLARRGDAGRAREMLTGTVRDLGALAQGFDGALLRAALQADPEMPVAPGVRAAVSALGLLDAARFAIVNHRGRHAATDAQVERQREQCDLVVEVDRGVIVGNRGAATVRGRPITCKLLAALIEAQPGVVTAEQLYLNVWGAAEYHPLRHRNTVYVALNRLRRTLSEMYPGRQLIERVPDGWRLDGSLSVCAIETTTHRAIGE